MMPDTHEEQIEPAGPATPPAQTSTPAPDPGHAGAQLHSATKTLDPTHATSAPLLGHGKASRLVRDWPTAPQPIHTPLYLIIWNSIFDLALFACACAFLVFGAIVGYYDRAPTVDHPIAKERLQDAVKYGPTTFPILFAMILGRATHALLLWRFERGERIGVLDTLATSTSFTSTIVSLFQMRAISVFGMALLAVWSLSPVGGQASLRQMGIGTEVHVETATFEYMVHNGNGYSFNSAYRVQWVSILDSVLNSAILAPLATRLTPRDPWGNVKIPRIEHYEANGVPDHDGWFDTANGSSATFTSIVGIPISSLDQGSFVDYRIQVQTSYLNVVCSLDITQSLLNISRSINTTYPNLQFRQFGPNGGTIYAEKTRYDRDPNQVDPYRFILATYFLNDDHDFTLDCSITGSYVETEINCPESASCAARKVRRSTLDHFNANWSFVDVAYPNVDVLFGDFWSSSAATLRGANLIQRYLSNPEDVTVSEDTLYLVNRTTEENYSVRMGQLLNSYFNVMNGLYAITGGIDEKTSYFWDKNMSFMPPKIPSPIPGRNGTIAYNFTGFGEERKAKTWTAEGSRSSSVEIIVAYKPWMVTLCIASIVLMLAALISPIVHHFLIKGPEIMMNVSSLATRDNPHISLPDGGTFLEASDRARLLRNVRVRHGDIGGSDDVGNLVIGAIATSNGQDIATIRRGIMYE